MEMKTNQGGPGVRKKDVKREKKKKETGVCRREAVISEGVGGVSKMRARRAHGEKGKVFVKAEKKNEKQV